ncbi:DUF2835 family protein [Pseudoalteromonas sp. Scap03]|jgi:hypothetical protein|uniref:DUF2835 domain-containing protein n=1 Tax=unclassified Pseudoalteromonas TaxID=194690 RepID=UPI00110B3B8B|nr:MULTISPECIES: DUF2835 domain-containing protein [unclassified Pseudoalteromonas]MDN3483999.1 DUF2835 domain-containing protein [Pseudoalteromonas sp. APC 3224]NWL16448.1 DUF2835 family protein [Pseudoalteromonas sp. Scap03]QLE81564.1 DUF2835 family protein [Pseudoalteromonas sp. Scap25]QLE89508.1 DUF2835 family protein [Pseudoalteromonas sp. Scap06]TMP71640.1 DUF2835 domain-containing protein [Pseudoalteromonas sp. S1609]
MIEHYFSMHLSYTKCMDYYHGRYSSIQVTADSGKTIRFSAHHLRPFISSLGIRGRFRLILSNENKFIRLERVA